MQDRTCYRVEYVNDHTKSLVGFYDDLTLAINSMDDMIPLKDPLSTEYYEVVAFKCATRPEDAFGYVLPIKTMRFGVSDSPNQQKQ